MLAPRRVRKNKRFVNHHVPAPPVDKCILTTLPVEMLNKIAFHAPSDTDVIHLGLSCQLMENVIECDKSEVWRNRLKAKYDPVPGEPDTFTDIYKYRQYILKIGCTYTDGTNLNEMCMADCVMALIIESFGSSKPESIPGMIDEVPEELNKCHLYYYLKESCNLIIDRGDHLRLDTFCSATLSSVRIFFTPWALDPDMMCGVEIHRFHQAQNMLLWSHLIAFKDDARAVICFQYLFAVQRFFQFLFLTEGEVYSDTYALLPAWSRPPPWERKLVNRTKRLRQHWIGGWVSGIRTSEPPHVVGRNSYPAFDMRTTEDFLTLTFEFDLTDYTRDIALPNNPFHFPLIYGSKGESFYFRPKVIQFTGRGYDSGSQFVIDGFLHEIPDQGCIPGWQRICFIKAHLNDAGVIDSSTFWYYEGIVIPGDGVMMGRWSTDPDPQYAAEGEFGPFILWCCDGCMNPDDEYVQHCDTVLQEYTARAQLLAVERQREAQDAIIQARSKLESAKTARDAANQAVEQASAELDAATDDAITADIYLEYVLSDLADPSQR